MADVTSGLQWAETAVSEKHRKTKEKTIFLVSGNSSYTKRGYYLRLRRLVFYFEKRGSLMLAITT